MAEVTEGILAGIISSYNVFLGSVPLWIKNFIELFLLVILVVIYSIFIWKLYRFIARKNVLNLDLNKYNKTNGSAIAKILAGMLYFLEYIIILPFLIFFWFAILTFFLILLTNNIPVNTILVISALTIAAVRMTAYYKEDISKELAKLLPLNLLAIAMLTPGFFSFERVFQNLSLLPAFFNEIIIYLLFIVVLEIVLRFFDFIFSFFGLEEEGEEKET
jgi:hypothetical protein